MNDYSKLINSYIAVVTRPGSTAAFDAAKGDANWMGVVVGVVVLGVVQAVFGLISAAIAGAAVGAALGVPGVGAAAFGGGISSLIITPITTLIFFFIFAGVLQYAGQWQGGKGDLLTTAYATALVYVPLGVVAAVLGVVPVLGGIAGLAVFLYQLFLLYFAVQSVHGLDSNKSIIVLVVTAVVFLIAAFVLGAVFAGLVLF